MGLDDSCTLAECLVRATPEVLEWSTLSALKDQEMLFGQIRFKKDIQRHRNMEAIFCHPRRGYAIDDNKHLGDSLRLGLEGVHGPWQMGGRNFISLPCFPRATCSEPFSFKARAGPIFQSIYE